METIIRLLLTKVMLLLHGMSVFVFFCLASASVAAFISVDNQDHNKEQDLDVVSFLVKQVFSASFDRLELGPSSFKQILLPGYSNGFQVINVEDASNVLELVSKPDDPVAFLQMQPHPAKSEGCEGFRKSHPFLFVVACDESKNSSPLFSCTDGLVRDGNNAPQTGNLPSSPATFYSLRSHNSYSAQIQDDELHVNVESILWWDVRLEQIGQKEMNVFMVLN